MKEKRRVIPAKLNLPLKRRRTKSLTTVLSFRISDDDLLVLRRLEAKTRRTASDILRDAFSRILKRNCES